MDSVNYSWIKLKSSTIDLFLALQLLILSGTLLVLTAVISVCLILIPGGQGTEKLRWEFQSHKTHMHSIHNVALKL